MSKNLVIVESPAKAKTISRFLGKDYTVLASMGHIRDLPKSKIGIDTEKNFEPVYVIPVDKKKIVSELKSKLKSDTTLYIATDEDREGEAIGWHLTKALKVDPKKNPIKRIVFHEITEGAIKDALKHPRGIDMKLVDAQQARRILDRIVGYELSPVLWKKIRYGLSAGRVQSVTVRLIVEREREIEAFKPDEYWSLEAYFAKKDNKKEFVGLLAKYKGKKIDVKNEKQADEILAAVKDADFVVKDITEKDVKRSPSPPFITSTLQQEASRKLNFSVKKTMMLAQQLYEGVEVGKNATGLITYMRTDSVNLSHVALSQAQEVIRKEYGDKYTLKTPRFYKSKKGAQEAHEAIRPTNLSVLPADLKDHLSRDQHRLYELIWKRTIACQMPDALLTQTGVDIDAQGTHYEFRANGQVVKFPGFRKVYKESSDNGDEDDENILPELSKGEDLDAKGFDSKQHFTKPPARYTEASLVKKLESEGIGRPSTYAPTISTVQARGYVKRDGRVLFPTELGEIVNDMLVKHFYGIVDYKFTADMEEQLDKIAEGKKEWVPIISEFYTGFHKIILEKQATLTKEDVINEKTKEKCDMCGSPMIIKFGRFGKFLSCSNYPECKNAKPLEGAAPLIDPETEKKFKDKKCSKCGKPMVVKMGRYGAFLGCSGYPDCKNIESIVKYADVNCPKCDAKLIERHARKSGKKFWGCSKFPKCKFATWDEPLRKCKCGGMIVKKGDKEVCMECKEESSK